MRENTFKRVIAELFILSLPLRMLSVFRPFTGAFGMQAESLSFIFHVLGLVLMLYSTRGRLRYNKKNSSILSSFIIMICVYAIISVIMSIYTYYVYGYYNGNSPFVAVIKLILDFIQYILVFVYSKEVFRILGIDRVLFLLTVSTRISLFVGYLQISELFGIPILNTTYRAIANIFSFRTYQSQIALTFYEPSWAAMFIGIVVIPIHLSYIYKNIKRISHIIELIVWIPVIVFTKSTSAYLLTLSVFLVGAVVHIFKKNGNINTKIISVCILSITMIVFIFPESIDRIFGFNFSYLLHDKISDSGNQSTMSRSVSIIGDYEIFKKFPLFGCGNGLQGYYYVDLILPQRYNNFHLDYATTLLLSGQSSSIPNGQSFFPGLLSGYGIIGSLFFVRFFTKLVKSSNNNDNQTLSLVFQLSVIPVCLSGIKSEYVGIIFIWFILSIPYVLEDQKKGVLDDKE